MESSLTNIIFHISTSRKSKLSRIDDTTGHQTFEKLILFFVLSGGPKTIAFSERFQRIFGRGILIIFENRGSITRLINGITRLTNGWGPRPGLPAIN